jgi:general secretion pathway protein G
MQRVLSIVVAWLAMLLAPQALAYSSRSGTTEARISRIAAALLAYRDEYGELPPMDHYWDALERAHLLEQHESGVPLDGWGRPLIYGVPGEHGAFDLYSAGKDGADNHGAMDDISNWAGINDGFYEKATWSRGRRTIALGLVLAAATLLLARRFPWRLVLPFAGFIVSLGIGLGCWWLMHPGIVSARNTPLELACAAAAICLSLTIACLIVHVRNHGWSIRVRVAPTVPLRQTS